MAGIESSGLVQHRNSAIRGLIVKSSKSDWLRIRNEYSAHAQKIGSRQSSRSLPQARRIVGSGDENVLRLNIGKDVRAHCYCASLVRTLYMTWRVSRHVFQARAPSRNSTKCRADDLCGNLICEYFCWMLDDPHFFFLQISSFSDTFNYTKNKKICTWEVLIISHILF